jgi:hypothetical protein
VPQQIWKKNVKRNTCISINVWKYGNILLDSNNQIDDFKAQANEITTSTYKKKHLE